LTAAGVVASAHAPDAGVSEVVSGSCPKMNPMATVTQWVEGTRPRTLPNSIAPVLVTALSVYGAVNTPEAIRGLELAYLIGPVFFVMVGGACFLGYKLTAQRHGEIRAELERRDAVYDEAPVLQSITGEPGEVLP